MHEIELSLPDGMVLRGQRWCTPPQQRVDDDKTVADDSTRILALHGWLDNCRSFYYLAPKLLEEFSKQDQTAEFVAIDLPGHGRSSHRPIDGPSAVLSEGLYYIAEAIDALGWNSHSDTNNSEPQEQQNPGVALVGHSMGGSLASLYAGVFPEQVSKLVSLDIYGPEPRNPQETHRNLRSHILQRKLGPKPKKATYPSLERAIERRQKAATLSRGGQQYISKQAATELVTRAMEPLYETESDEAIIQGYQFLHDARLMWPSLQYMTQEQIQSILEAVECPVCILAAEDGYPFEKDRIDRVVTALNPEIHKILPGSHHFHADPDTADAVAEAVYEFFCQDETNNADPAKR